MKRIVVLIIIICTAMACQKESSLTPRVNFENLYMITDDPHDEVQHKRYLLWKEYGVPVYFNDTIGKTFTKINEAGDSVFIYETLDLNWAFNSNNTSSTEYMAVYLTDREQQLHALKIAEHFLETVAPPLHPYALWITAQCRVFASTGVTTPTFISRYRNLLMANPAAYDTDAKIESYVRNIQLEMIKEKINNYPDEVEAFKSVSNKEYYSTTWQSLDPTLSAPIQNMSGTMSWPARALDEMYKGDTSYRTSLKMPYYGGWTDEQFDEHIVFTRQVVGSYGFINYGLANTLTPNNSTSDFNTYVEKMLEYSPEQFKAWWGDSPLVMKKYEILYAIIRDKLGVSL